jgi:2-succinyl-5-enolpyruvyl-6-hydroxy-3-cyclohexene-1-carboxylate synthase
LPEAQTAGDVALACMSALVDELVHRGMTDACVSPGSRSTPIALALARHGGVRVHVILDERSSAFFALGMAKAAHRAVAVACTSGTAVANLFPAVVEASMSRTPLLLLTADRPPELRGVGANQTIDQVGMFGPYPRWAVDADVPDLDPHAARRWRELAARAHREAHGPPAGPVHLNLPFREPLVPTGAAVDLGPDDVERHHRFTDLPAHGPEDAVPPTPGPSADAVDEVTRLAGASRRGLILAGGSDATTTMAGGSVDALAGATSWPVLAEPHAGPTVRRPPHALAAGQHLLVDEPFVTANAPDVAIQLGAAPTSRAGQAVLARAGRLVVVAADAARSDPSGRPALHVDAAPDRFAHAVARLLSPAEPAAWTGAWREADLAARAAVDAVLDAHDEPFEGRIARDLFATIPEAAVLFAGSSMPIRDLDAYAAPRAGHGVRVVANRGASGIDGSVSTALGVAAVAERRAFALIGDLALLHDAGALLWSGVRGVDAVFVVPNNGGGGIFDLLPVASQPEHERLFVTPHAVDLSALSATAGVGYTRVDRAGRLPDAVLAAVGLGGVHVIDVAVDRAVGLRIRREVRDAVRAALSALGYA